MTPTWVSPCGTVQLWLGDCLTVLPHVEADCVVTDPPYGIVNEFGTSDLYGTRRMQFHFDHAGVPEIVAKAFGMSLDTGASAFHLFCDPEHYGTISAEARQRGFTPKPFAKVKLCPPPPMPGNWWPSAFELAMYGYRSGAWFGDDSGKRCNVIVADSYRHGIRSHEKVDHPTQKWLPMVQQIVSSIVEPDTVCLDPFMGSGTTGVACVRTGRKFIGIELEPKYFEIAQRRIEAELNRFPLFEQPQAKQLELIA